MINKDMVKALRCIASTNDMYSCYSAQWNDSTPKNPNKMICSDNSQLGTVCCPYFQNTYNTCYEEEEGFAWMNGLADELEKILNKKGETVQL